MNVMCRLNDGVEDELHYLLLCPSLDPQRRILIERVLSLLKPLGFNNPSNKLLTLILLYGCKDMPFTMNGIALRGMPWYVKETRRFD